MPPPPANAAIGDLMDLTVMQDARGHPVVWGKHVGLDPIAQGPPMIRSEPPSYPNSQETVPYGMGTGAAYFRLENRRQIEESCRERRHDPRQ